MFTRSMVALAGFVGMAMSLPLLGGCATTGDLESRILSAKDRVAPALVHIRPVKEVYTEGKREEMLAVGSGFIISPDGYIVTNEHVAGQSSSVNVILYDKREVQAKVVGVDPYTDLAVLKLEVEDKLPYVKMGQSSGLEAGERVLALGSPHGLSRSVSEGIISVTDRHLEDRGTMVSPFNTWLQTDAAINPGNSGGPLVNLRGEVVGINARVLTGADNVGFAIPVDVAREVVAEIMETGKVERSSLGVSLQQMLARTLDPELEGVLVADVDPLSPASDADVRPGDILLAVNGVPVNARFEEDLPVVQKLLADLPVEAAATLTLSRGNERRDIEVRPEPLGGLTGTEREIPAWGFTAADLTPQQVRRALLPVRQGVYVSGVQMGGLAQKAGLQQGDIILRMDKREVENLERYLEHYQHKLQSPEDLVLLFVKRGALTRFVLLEQTGLPRQEMALGTAPATTEVALQEQGETTDAK